MIVRAILDQPSLIQSGFDFFNDADDTLRWLCYVRKDNFKAILVEIQLRAAYESWMVSRLLGMSR